MILPRTAKQHGTPRTRLHFDEPCGPLISPAVASKLPLYETTTLCKPPVQSSGQPHHHSGALKKQHSGHSQEVPSAGTCHAITIKRPEPVRGGDKRLAAIRKALPRTKYVNKLPPFPEPPHKTTNSSKSDASWWLHRGCSFTRALANIRQICTSTSPARCPAAGKSFRLSVIILQPEL